MSDTSLYRPSKIYISNFQCIEMVDINEPFLVGELGEIWIHESNIYGVAITDAEQALTLLQELGIHKYEVQGSTILFLIEDRFIDKVLKVIKPLDACHLQIARTECTGPLLSQPPSLGTICSNKKTNYKEPTRPGLDLRKIEETAETIIEFLEKQQRAFELLRLQKLVRRKRQYVIHAIRMLQQRDVIHVIGSGKKGDPKRYYLKGTLENKLSPNNEDESKLFETLIFN